MGRHMSPVEAMNQDFVLVVRNQRHRLISQMSTTSRSVKNSKPALFIIPISRQANAGFDLKLAEKSQH